MSNSVPSVPLTQREHLMENLLQASVSEGCWYAHMNCPGVCDYYPIFLAEPDAQVGIRNLGSKQSLMGQLKTGLLEALIPTIYSPPCKLNPVLRL